MRNSPFIVAIAAAAAFAVQATSVSAQQDVDWSGFYAGMFGGYSSGESDWNMVNDAGVIVLSSTPNLEGLQGGVMVGYNHQWNNGIVLGGEIDIAAGTLGGQAGVAGILPGNFLMSDVKMTASARVKGGFALGSFLPYLTGGVASAMVNHTVTNGDFSFDVNDAVRWGWTVGAGVDFAATDNFSVGAEYRYSNFSGGQEQAAPAFLGGTDSYDLSSHAVRLTGKFHF